MSARHYLGGSFLLGEQGNLSQADLVVLTLSLAGLGLILCALLIYFMRED